jgi:hypothetical protein
MHLPSYAAAAAAAAAAVLLRQSRSFKFALRPSTSLSLDFLTAAVACRSPYRGSVTSAETRPCSVARRRRHLAVDGFNVRARRVNRGELVPVLTTDQRTVDRSPAAALCFPRAQTVFISLSPFISSCDGRRSPKSTVNTSQWRLHHITATRGTSCDWANATVGNLTTLRCIPGCDIWAFCVQITAEIVYV